MHNENSPGSDFVRSLHRSFLAALLALTVVLVAVVAAVESAGAAPGDFSIEPGSLDFGPVELGDSVSLSITVTNTTAAPATPDLSGSGTSGDFAMSSHCNVSVAPGDSCTVDIRFSPSTLGPSAGTALMHVSGSSRSVSLTGEGVEPLSYSLSPSTLDFGEVAVGEQATLSATITNTSSTAATPHVEGTVLSPFSFGSGTCLDTLLAGESCTGTIVFSPTSEGPSAGTAFITADGDPIGQIALQGNGVAPAVVDPGVTASTDPPPTTDPTAGGSATTVTPPGSGSVTPSAGPGTAPSTLPRTGSDSTLIVVSMAVTLVAIGGVVLAVRRRLRD